MNVDFASLPSSQLRKLIREARAHEASDLHVIAGLPPAFRVNGEIILADEDALRPSDVEEMALSLLNPRQREKFEIEWELCISFYHEEVGRIRATIYRRN